VPACVSTTIVTTAFVIAEAAAAIVTIVRNYFEPAAFVFHFGASPRTTVRPQRIGGRRAILFMLRKEICIVFVIINLLFWI